MKWKCNDQRRKSVDVTLDIDYGKTINTQAKIPKSLKEK